jgi:hypothetical protein
MWSFPLSRGGRSNSGQLHEALLSEKYRDGLASKECHVRFFYLHFFEDNAYFLQADSFVPRDKNHE